jgi:hypothetical protein
MRKISNWYPRYCEEAGQGTSAFSIVAIFEEPATKKKDN